MFLVVVLLFPIFILHSPFPAYAAETVYCQECGQSFSLTNEDDVKTHPDNSCSHAGEDVSIATSFVASTPPAGGEGGDSAEMAFGEAFIRNMMDTIFNIDPDVGDADTPSFTSPEYLLELSFECLIGDDGVIDTIIEHDGYKFLVAACFLIMLLRFVSDYALDKVWDVDKQTPEMLFKPIFKLIAAMVFVLCLPWFFKFALYLSQGAYRIFSTIGNETGGSNVDDILNIAKDSLVTELGFVPGGISKLPQNIGAMISGVVTLILPYIISLICNVGIFFTIFSRILEIGVHLTLSPLAMTDIYKGGDHARGMRYLYEFFGLCFQSVAIMVVFLASNMVSATLINELISVFEERAGMGIAGISQIAMALSAINLAKLVIMLRTASISKSAFGGS